MKLDPDEYAQFLALLARHQAHAARKVYVPWIPEAPSLRPPERSERQIARQRNRFDMGGRFQTLGEWAKESGLSYHTLYRRIVILEWSVEKALAAPPDARRARRSPA